MMTTVEVAEMLNIPLETLYAWRQRRLGPLGYRVGRHIRYRRSTVESWLEARWTSVTDRSGRRLVSGCCVRADAVQGCARCRGRSARLVTTAVSRGGCGSGAVGR